MEGGSPSLIWERWTLPMYRAQLRYWGDHPRIDHVLRAAYSKKRPRYTPPPENADADGPRPFDWSQLDKA